MDNTQHPDPYSPNKPVTSPAKKKKITYLLDVSMYCYLVIEMYLDIVKVF